MWTTLVPGFIATVFLAKQSSAASSAIDYWLAAHPISTKVSSVNPTPTSVFNRDASVLLSFNSALNRCPAGCSDSGSNSANWTAYHDTGRLAACNETMLLDFTIYNALNDSNTQTTIFACTTSSAKDASKALLRRDAICHSSKNYNNAEVSLKLGWSGALRKNTSDIVSAAEQLETHLTLKEDQCGEKIAFAYSGTVAMGIYAGSKIQAATSVLEDFIAEVISNGVSDTVFVQHCAGNGLNSNYAFGIVARMDGDLAEVQETIRSWRDSGCITSYDESTTWNNVTISLATQVNVGNHTSANDTLSASKHRRSLRQRDTCTTVVVASGDGCGTLADECGISAADFTTYNPSPTLCSSLAVGQHVCCSDGDLPNYSPQPNADGTCATYTVVTNDSCSQLAALNSITNDDIESFNKNTWGWMGCADLQAGYNICLSTGDPPMPAIVTNAICGPQVPGTIKSTSGLDLSLYSQCSINACCDVWGQCGTTAEFCTKTQSPTGAPGTAAAGTNGCISNCGTEIIVGDPPTEFKKVGYWEGYNFHRPCLNRPITSINTTAGYTHVHLAFATITSTFEVDISSIQEAFSEFLDMSGLGFKRILSFGGWDFSTNPATYQIFRDAMAPANSKKLAANVAAFLQKYDLDGVDFDWEYPGEPDIPGIPAGSLEDGANYARFFDELAAVLPAGKTQSVTAPTSYWYLRPFLILSISEIVDYIVYMTYDLHGQWDYNSAFSDTSCAAGNCLRSGVNLTETLNSLSMITKAGVPSHKVIVGVTSYGRSFQMTTPGCYSSSCTYTGPTSGAYAGACTRTAGYIANAEIDSIISGNAAVFGTDGSSIQVTGTPFVYLDDSYSNIVVYNNDQWISYMDDANKNVRIALFKSYNFGGTADWAVDLQSYDGDNGNSNDGSSIVYVDPSIWTGLTSTGGETSGGTSGTSNDFSIAYEPPCVIVLPPYPLGTTTTVVWPELTTTFLSFSAGELQTVTSTISVPPFAISEVNFQPITLGATHRSSYTIFPMQSIMPSSFAYTLPAFQETFSPTPIPTTHGFSVSLGGGSISVSATTSSSTSSTAIAAIVWHSTPHLITIQPMPTSSIILPPLTTPIPTITITSGKPKSTKSASGDGTRDCRIFGCKPSCGLFGCDGGCGIFGCGGGCGPFGCNGDCPLGVCGGLGCAGGACGSRPSNNNDNDCDKPVTASACTVIISSWSTSPMTEYSTTTRTECEETVACTAEDTRTTTTKTTGYPVTTASMTGFYDSEPASINTKYDSIASSIIHAGLEYYGFVKSTGTKTVTPTPTAIVPRAVCFLLQDILWYNVQIITNGFETDLGAAIKKQEHGCGDLLSWKATDVSLPENNAAWTGTREYSFTLPLTIKAGCVERAIARAGGPKRLSCDNM